MHAVVSKLSGERSGRGGIAGMAGRVEGRDARLRRVGVEKR